ncbi:uncharacterized protein N7477_000052 [Penicillium maclennaniae]|uniref:uncharacterized protein n=1 Tax=Penicillium maclennaniae TaxID=1343394 RepID=UPI00253FE141|nr:uncharacterized protein N7477_000052 [Penicillium maclennaniae]KAJ5683707.1 hypothetical protein N7477_000052 [Penicillium maclennaniae]
MRLSFLLGLAGLVNAIEQSDGTYSSTVYITRTATGSSPSAPYTAIDDAIAYAQRNNIPTVTVLPGTYAAVTISATPSVAVYGKTSNPNDFTQNQVVVSSDGTALAISADIAGITVRNINFIDTSSSGEAASLKGNKNGFYQCQFISGSTAITMNPGVGLIANSYIEASDKVIAGQGNLYVFNTAIVPSQDSALVVQYQGTMSSNPKSDLFKSTIVIDRSSVSQKARGNSKDCYLAGASGKGSVVVYRSCILGSLIAPSGVHVDSTTQDESNFYGEYANSGLGSYANNRAARSKYVTSLGPLDLSSYSLSAVLAGGNPAFATSDTTWIDPNVLAAIESADVLGLYPPPDGSGGGPGSSGGSAPGSSDDTSGSGSGSGSDDGSGSGSSSSDDSGTGSSSSGDSSGSSATGQAQLRDLGMAQARPMTALVLPLGPAPEIVQEQALGDQALRARARALGLAALVALNPVRVAPVLVALPLVALVALALEALALEALALEALALEALALEALALLRLCRFWYWQLWIHYDWL